MLTSADLKNVAYGGLINEDVMQRIFDISRIPLPATDYFGTGPSVQNSYTEWTVDRLADPNTNNAKVDGADTNTDDDTSTGERVGNHCQISTKTVKVSTRADASDTIGYARELAHQVMRRQQELRRDVEAIQLLNQTSVADNGSNTAGRVGGLAAWIETNLPADWTGTAGGFSNGTVSAYTPATSAVTGSESNFKEVINKVWNGGGDPRRAMSVPSVIEKLSEYMFTNSAKIATLHGNTSADSGSDQLTAKASVNVYVADHGQVIEFMPNRLQQLASNGRADLFILDGEYAEQGFLHGYRTEPLAKTGLAEQRQMSVDWTLRVNNEEAHGMMPDLDPTADWTA